MAGLAKRLVKNLSKRTLAHCS